MRIAVVGAGIVGVTTAWELVRDGHEVTVFERCASVAAMTSFANAGVIAPGYVTPWAAPGMPTKVLAHLLSRHSPVRFGAGTLAATPWLWRFLRACRTTPYRAHRTQLQRLARYSRERLDDVVGELKLQFERGDGYMVLLRSARELTQARGGMALLQELGVNFQLLDEAAARRIEPGLDASAPLHAAIHLPQDGVGNCRQFAHLLKSHAQARGARFVFGSDVQRLDSGDGVTVVTRDAEAPSAPRSERFDAAVVCAGHQAGVLLRPLGLRVPLLPVYGYSVTAPLRQRDGLPELGPRSALMDERYKVAISRLGQRVRVAGSAEIGGRAGQLRPAALATLYKVLDDWFPGAAEVSKAQAWKGARPMLPDGPPLIGASGRPGVWLNLGHGSSGWALSCGSARLLADLVGGRTPAIEAAGFDAVRLR